MRMPILKPIPIKTKGLPLFKRIWRWITSIREWEVIEDWKYELDDSLIIIIPQGFIFDGASIPRLLWGILAPVGSLLIPGLIHDYDYRYNYLWAVDSEGTCFKHKEGAGQSYWDRMFKEIGKDVNGMKVLDILAWFALTIGGRFAWNSNRKRIEPELKPKC